ncbi:hypothetical protein L7F22_032680 [Adiantum nelumboides]|nr:hypothetical protein [Adiantum nelumboides]
MVRRSMQSSEYLQRKVVYSDTLLTVVLTHAIYDAPLVNSQFYNHYLPVLEFDCIFFRWITSKETNISSIAQKKRECIELLCLMEKALPTSFFDIQVHVLMHLVDEIEIAGVVSTR